VKHALVGEAVAEALLPGERAELSEAVGMTLLARGDPGVAGEAADHLAAARHPRELPARITAAEHAKGIYAFTTAAHQWERATMLAEAFDHSRSQVGELALRTMIAWDYDGEVLRGEECGRTGLRAARAHGQRQTEVALLIRPAMIHNITDRN